jgi:hypothetical protein
MTATMTVIKIIVSLTIAISAGARNPLTKVKTARTTKATISEISMLTPIWAITTWMPKICRAM